MAEEESTEKLWKMTPARKAAMLKNIKKAQVAAKKAAAKKRKKPVRRREPILEITEVPLRYPGASPTREYDLYAIAELIVAVATLLHRPR